LKSNFQLSNEFYPTGDQPEAINSLVKGIHAGQKMQTLLGVTGSGKTFTIANVIAKVEKNALIISHNKTLAAQLYYEFRNFFPNNNIGYFVSFYDYYQPESYIPQTDTYIEKDTEVNDKIEKMRLEATAMLMSGDPTIIVSTVSCIYSLGSPTEWEESTIAISRGMKIDRKTLIYRFIESRYERNDINLIPGNFRVKGDIIDIIPAYSEDVVRISLFGDLVEDIYILNHITLRPKRHVNNIRIFPAKHYIIDDDKRKNAIKSIENELKDWLPHLKDLEKQRLESRTKYDLEMIEELGYCSGIENYSRHFDGRMEGQPPFCLLDFFGKDFLLVIDESHVTMPQLRGMYHGDYTRKKNLIDYGFRLPSAFDNRPLKFTEFEKYLCTSIFVSATPSEYEHTNSSTIVEQLVRPTGLLDPKVEVRPRKDQIKDLIFEIKKCISRNQRILVTTLTKRMAEDLAEYLARMDIKVRYMHSEIDTIERTELIRRLRIGEFDVMVGINLLREGLDIPEVSLVAILDADKEGFLRNTTSLVQTFGRAARNIDGKVIMYADSVTLSMNDAIVETERRRQKQLSYNRIHNIIPRSIIKSIADKPDLVDINIEIKSMAKTDLNSFAIDIETKMRRYAERLDFEKAIELREQLVKIRKVLNSIPVDSGK
jgi:excinuclease ABC subunit B